MAGRKVTFDTEKALFLLKKGYKQKEIASMVSVKESTLKMFFKRHAADELALKKSVRKSRKNDDEFVLESSNLLTVDDCKEILNSRSYGIMPNESMSTNAFIRACFHSYKTDLRTGRVKFDTTRGAKTKDVPASYMPGQDYKSKYKCLILTNGLTKCVTVHAYDNYEARVEIKKKVDIDCFAILECEKVL